MQVKDFPDDSVEFATKKDETSLTKEEKQEIVLKARTTAAGWSVAGKDKLPFLLCLKIKFLRQVL